MERVTLFCFAASYTVALCLELWHLYQRLPVQRVLANVFGGAGLLAHTIYLAVQRPPLGWQYGLLLALAWILAIFYLYGSVHHARQAWGIFVLPLVLVLVGLATLFGAPTGPEGGRVSGLFSLEDRKLLSITHATLLILAAVGVCVAFVASLMYLVQAHRLKAKMLPGEGLRLPSLERLETMNRRALTLAFPLLTIGALLGIVLMGHAAHEIADWRDPRVLSTVLLWLVFALLLYLRFGLHLRGRRVALLTLVAFGLLLLTLALPHMGRGGAVP
jgi:ABC-type transport system involved in cytochrome c biogenesis permease subunit